MSIQDDVEIKKYNYKIRQEHKQLSVENEQLKKEIQLLKLEQKIKKEIETYKKIDVDEPDGEFRSVSFYMAKSRIEEIQKEISEVKGA